MGLYWHLKSLVLKGSTFNQWTTKSVTLELVNEFYFKGSILEFTKVFFPDNLLGNLSKGVLSHASQPELKSFPL